MLVIPIYPYLTYFDDSFSFWKEEIMIFGNLEDRCKGLALPEW